MKIIPKTKDVKNLLDKLNKEYYKKHKTFEDLFWTSYMGDHSVDGRFAKAKAELEKFKSNRDLAKEVDEALKVKDKKLKERVGYWKKSFDIWQIPSELLDLRDDVMKLEAKIKEKQTSYNYGYIDPKSKKFVPASRHKLSLNVYTNDEEPIRKASYEALQKNATLWIDDYIKYVGLLNSFAKKLGYKDFYAYKIFVEEGMTKKELFSIFDKIFKQTKVAFPKVRALAKGKPGMDKPWNFTYMTSANFAKEEDPYFQFETALPVWAQTFANLGVDFRGSSIRLDLLDRKGKYDNGFCHWPEPIHFENGKRKSGHANFTCNLVPKAIGSGADGIHTLFHEGGHAAHYLNSDIHDICINTEYPPASTAWAETQSMFMDTIFSSIEWETRYAKNKEGRSYPFDLFERKLEKLNVFSPLRMMGIMMVMYFEKEIYETKNLTKEKVISIAKKVRNKLSTFKWDGLGILNTPHIYSWESACSYHGYGLAELSLSQWREYFYKKYGYIVDNPNIGKEMLKVWKLASTKTFPDFVKMATGKSLTADAFIKSAMMSKEDKLKLAKQRIEKLSKVKRKNTYDIGAKIELVHGKKKISDNSKGFEFMVKKYNSWLAKQ
ncbi:hypothetical protein IT397_00895 [Candidatus Nomurabacteria bacterium]|nr:hypothetical protein [Candidatus Nomurabacteria bacterium]